MVKFLFFSLVFVILVSGVCLSCILFSLNWVCWVRGSLASRVMYTLRVRISLLCGVAGRHNFIWALWWCGRRDCTDISFSLWLCSGGYGTVEMVKGVARVFLCCLQFAVSSLCGWISSVGIFV